MPNDKKGLQLWLAKLQSEKGVKWAMALGAVGVVLILLSEWMPQKTTAEAAAAAVTAESYCADIEQRLCALLQDMEGVGSCSVYVTLENGVEYVYAKEQQENADRSEDRDESSEQVKESADTQESVILIDGDNGETGLLLTEIQPQVKGVVVVCSGGNDEAVIERVTAVVTTALNISARRVCVTK